MVFMVSRLKQVFGNVFAVWNKIWKVLGCGWRIGIGKLKEMTG